MKRKVWARSMILVPPHLSAHRRSHKVDHRVAVKIGTVSCMFADQKVRTCLGMHSHTAKMFPDTPMVCIL